MGVNFPYWKKNPHIGRKNTILGIPILAFQYGKKPILETHIGPNMGEKMPIWGFLVPSEALQITNVVIYLYLKVLLH